MAWRGMEMKMLGLVMNLPMYVSVILIRVYQLCISPWLGKRCRFYPSCSKYAILALKEWGFLKGSWLTVKRLVKCGPWHEGGYDPPPHRNDQSL